MEPSKYVLLVFLAITCLSAVSWAGNADYEEVVRAQCGYTRYPTLCDQTLTQLAPRVRNIDFLSALVNETISQTKIPNSYTSNFISPDSQLIQTATDYCHELMEMSLKRLNQAMELVQKSPKKHKADIQTWLSAALTFQESCRDSIKEHVASDAYTAEVYKKMDHLSELGSNSLALANRIAAEPTPTGRRLLERESGVFPSWVSAADRKLLQSTAAVKANAVVAKDGSGNFKTVAEAINAATGGRYVIYVKAGTYNEKINSNKDGITLIGDGKYSTIITAGSSVGKGASLKGSATFTVHGDGFIARDIGFENDAGAEGHQAIALNIASDRSVLYRCSITGYQDTLYAHSLRQFYRECDIHGTIDYIFGNAAAVFQNCNLIFRRPRSGASFNAILANGRTDPGQNTGFSVHNCRISVGSDFSSAKSSFGLYLGRPWKAYSRAVVMQTNIAGQISPRGWVEWEGSSGSTYKTLYFAEYGNMGAGAATSGRVSWPGYHVIGTPEATKFTVANFIGGTSWLPSTGVAFDAGL